MARAGVEDVPGIVARVDRAALATAATWLAFAGVLAAVLVAGTTSAGTLLEGWQVAALLVLFGVAVATRRFLAGTDEGASGSGRARDVPAAPEEVDGPATESTEAGDGATASDDRASTAEGAGADASGRGYAVLLVAAAIVLEALARSSTPGLLPVLPRGLEVSALGLVVLALLVAYRPGGFSRGQWLLVGAYVVVAATYLSHSLAAPPTGLGARWPLWAVVVAGVCLVLVPRFVSSRGFLWSLAAASALVALPGVVSAVTGEFSVWAFDVGVTTSDRGVRAWTGLPRVRSVYRNPNALGLVAFAGAVAAAVELHRAVRDRRWVVALLAVALLAVDAAALLLSHSRASWLAAAVASGCYAGYVALGRRSVPYVTLAGCLAVGGVMLLLSRGVLPGDTTGRVELWRASLRAFRASPTLLGEGHVSTSRVIAPHLDRESATTPHNSYLSILLRTGLVGALAYATLVLGAIAEGVRLRERVDLGALALAVGWAVHQLFESYTAFQWTPPAVLAALALGFAAFGSTAGERSGGTGSTLPAAWSAWLAERRRRLLS